MNIEKLRKILIYLTADDQWWRAGADIEKLKKRVGPVEPYLIDLTGRLDDGHFAPFDHQGIPMKNFGGITGAVYNITRVCGYGLACFDRYLNTGEEVWRERFVGVANWLMEHGERDERQGYVWRYTYAHGGRPAGRISGMAQGQGIAVYVRAYYLTRDETWLSYAKEALRSFEMPMVEGGVVARFSEIGMDWYEELISDPPTHILNGHIYALSGIRDLAVYLKVDHAQLLYDRGLESLIAALKHYDCGFWSLYDLPEQGPRYVASYSYHLMHCVLLAQLASWHIDLSDLQKYAQQWDVYRRSMYCRIQAAVTMIGQKIKKTRSR